MKKQSLFGVAVAVVAACGSGGGGADGGPDADPAAWHELDLPVSGSYGWVWTGGDALFVYGNDFSTYRSVDEGTTWQQLPYSYLALSRDGARVYGNASLDGIDGLSRDGGATWTDHPLVMDVEAVAEDPNLVYGFVAVYDPVGEVWGRDPYRSANAGVDTVPLAVDATTETFVTDPVLPDRVYALALQGTDVAVAYRSDDRGATWTQISFAEGKLRVDPGEAGVVWRFDGTSVGHSDDAGDAWTALEAAPAPVLELLPTGDGDALAFTADLAIRRVTAGGAWTEVGETPEAVGSAYLGATPETLIIVPAGDFRQTLYLSRTLGN